MFEPRYIRLVAKRASECRRCRGTIRPGERFEWAIGWGGRHLKCDEFQCPECGVNHSAGSVCHGGFTPDDEPW